KKVHQMQHDRNSPGSLVPKLFRLQNAFRFNFSIAKRIFLLHTQFMENKLTYESLELAISALRTHAKEITKAAREHGKLRRDGWKILAEADFDGNWLGCGLVSPGTGSFISRNGTGIALFVPCNSF